MSPLHSNPSIETQRVLASSASFSLRTVGLEMILRDQTVRSEGVWDVKLISTRNSTFNGILNHLDKSALLLFCGGGTNN